MGVDRVSPTLSYGKVKRWMKGKGRPRGQWREREREVPAEGEKDERDGVVKGRFNKIKETRSYQNLYDTNAEKMRLSHVWMIWEHGEMGGLPCCLPHFPYRPTLILLNYYYYYYYYFFFCVGKSHEMLTRDSKKYTWLWKTVKEIV